MSTISFDLIVFSFFIYMEIKTLAQCSPSVPSVVSGCPEDGRHKARVCH